MNFFQKYLPTEQLRPYVRHYAIAESDEGNTYKVFPTPGMVLGFQYSGGLSVVADEALHRLSTSGITGISDSFKVFNTLPVTGTVLIYFTETGFSRFSGIPASHLHNLSISLADVMPNQAVMEVEERLSSAGSHQHRILIVEEFICQHMKQVAADPLITEAVRLICASSGTLRIKDLRQQLFISADPLEKRFKRLVGITPKKFAAIVRFNHVLGLVDRAPALTGVSYDNGYFDQAHFIKDFRKFTGEQPATYRRRTEK